MTRHVSPPASAYEAKDNVGMNVCVVYHVKIKLKREEVVPSVRLLLVCSPLECTVHMPHNFTLFSRFVICVRRCFAWSGGRARWHVSVSFLGTGSGTCVEFRRGGYFSFILLVQTLQPKVSRVVAAIFVTLSCACDPLSWCSW